MKRRSTQKELMDLGAYTPDEYRECLEKLFLVGKYSGIHRDTYKVLEQVKPETILDVGCGDGSLVRAIAKRFPDTICRGIDISQEAIALAAPSQNASFSCTSSLEPADVVMATLVCHHMSDEELEQFLVAAYSAAKRLVLINDLQRHRLSRALFRLLSGPLFSNRLISHDGPVSIERGFYKCELQRVIDKVSPDDFAINWRFPFRWQVLLWKR